MPQKRAIHAALVGLMAGAKTIIPPGRFMVWTSTDRRMSHNGLNWSGAVASNAGGTVKQTLLDPLGSSRIFALVGIGAQTLVKYSDDFGITWTTAHTIAKPLGSNDRLFYHGGFFYAACGSQSGTPSGRARSADGVTWTPLADTPLDASFITFMGPWVGNQIIVGNIVNQNAYVSSDNGATWTPKTNVTVDQGDTAVLPSGRVAIAARADYATQPTRGYTDDGVTLTPVNFSTTPEGLALDRMAYVPFLQSVVLCRHAGRQFLGSNADATAWQRYLFEAGTTNAPEDFAFSDNRLVFSSAGGGVSYAVTSISPLIWQKSSAAVAGTGIVWHPTAE